MIQVCILSIDASSMKHHPQFHALKVVANGANTLRRPDRAIIIVTHYQRLLNYIVPDRVHVMLDGRIVKSGDKNLAVQLEEKGYDFIEKEARQTAHA